MRFERHAIFGTGMKHKIAHGERNEFCYVRNPDLSRYLLSRDNSDMICLRPTSNSLSSPTGTLTFIAKRQRSMKCVATVILEVPGQSQHPDNFVAGLAVYKDHLRHASIAYNSTASQVQLDMSNSESDTRHAKAYKVGPNMTRLGLRIIASSEKYIFSFQDGSAPSGSWVELGIINVQTLHAREFTGHVLGIFATDGKRDAVFRDFVVQ